MPTFVIATIRRLRAEAGASLHGVLRRVDKARASGEPPDFRGMRGGLFDLGERMSSPGWGIECQLLLPALAARTRLPRRLARLCGDDGGRDLERLAELQEAVTAFELVGEPMRGRLELLALLFTEWQCVRRDVFEHLAVPLAQAHLAGAAGAMLEAQARLRLRDTVPGAPPRLGRPRRGPAAAGAAVPAATGASHDPLLRRRLLAHALRRCDPLAAEVWTTDRPDSPREACVQLHA